MTTSNLPLLLTNGLGEICRCSGCSWEEFQTPSGPGSVFCWKGMGMRVRLGSPFGGPPLESPITCTRCNREHQAKAETSDHAAQSRIIGT